MAYHSGMLNRIIELDAPSVSRDAFGAEVRSWALQRRLAAAILPVRGREYMAADHLRADVEVKFVIRWQPDLAILPTWRVRVDGVVHNIKSVIHPAADRAWLEIMATAGVSLG